MFTSISGTPSILYTGMAEAISLIPAPSVGLSATAGTVFPAVVAATGVAVDRALVSSVDEYMNDDYSNEAAAARQTEPERQAARQTEPERQAATTEPERQAATRPSRKGRRIRKRAPAMRRLRFQWRPPRRSWPRRKGRQGRQGRRTRRITLIYRLVRGIVGWIIH